MLVHVEEKGVDVVFYDNIPSKDWDASLKLPSRKRVSRS
jgi:hypothetical protein